MPSTPRATGKSSVNWGQKLWMAVHIWWCLYVSVICKKKLRSNSTDWECHCKTWSECQQEQFVHNYVESGIISGPQCINPSLQKWMHIWELSGAKATGIGLQRCGNKLYGQMTHLSKSWQQIVCRWEPTGLWSQRGSGGSFTLWGGICRHELDPLLSFEGVLPIPGPLDLSPCTF